MMINKRLIAMVPGIKGFILGKALMNWCSLLAGVLLWFSVSGLLEQVWRGTVTVNGGAVCFPIAAVCIVLRFALTHVATMLTHRATASVKGQLRRLIYEKLRRLGGGYSDAFPTAEVVQLAGEGVEQLESYFGNYLPQLFYAVLAPLTLFLVFLPLVPLAAVTLFICVPLIPVAIMSVQRVAKRLLSKYWDAYTDLGDGFLENLQGLTTLKVYSADADRHEKMNQASERFRVVTMKVLTMQLNSITIMDLVAYGGTALGSILCVRTFLLGDLSLGHAIAMILLASEFFLAMRALGSYFHVAMNGMAASERMFRLLDLPEGEEGEQKAENGNITIENLSYSYDGEKQVLSNLNQTIPRGGLVSVCGESGSGKSTLAGLISGLYTGFEGRIQIGQVEVRDATKQSLRQLVTVVASGSYLFAGTVRNTLLEGRESATETEMWQTLERVKLRDFVQVQGGLDMPLTERAANLSGGQRQRLALARALMKNSPIYLFDEATSNIDAESEEDIMAAIYALRGEHTVLLISHRLSNVVESDEILFLEDGRLKERGSHTALMERGGGYARLYTAQKELENLRGGG